MDSFLRSALPRLLACRFLIKTQHALTTAHVSSPVLSRTDSSSYFRKYSMMPLSLNASRHSPRLQHPPTQTPSRTRPPGGKLVSQHVVKKSKGSICSICKRSRERSHEVVCHTLHGQARTHRLALLRGAAPATLVTVSSRTN